MVGALQLDTECLQGKNFINLDSEEDDTVTVSCAGGSEFKITLPISREAVQGDIANIKLFGLKGGHSGVEIHKGRVNANVLAGRILNHLYQSTKFSIISIDGGDKSNAITFESCIRLLVDDLEAFKNEFYAYMTTVKSEIAFREPDFNFELSAEENVEIAALNSISTEKLIILLNTAPNGIINMSAEIDGLVETSLNLGILKTNESSATLNFALRSNKNSALEFLEEKLIILAKSVNAKTEVFGHYPPWEYNPNNRLQKLYCESFKEFYGFEPKIEAIHAGLECGVFASKIPGLCCIAVGPQMYDVHTVNERLSISSTEKFTHLLLTVLEKL